MCFAHSAARFALRLMRTCPPRLIAKRPARQGVWAKISNNKKTLHLSRSLSQIFPLSSYFLHRRKSQSSHWKNIENNSLDSRLLTLDPWPSTYNTTCDFGFSFAQVVTSQRWMRWMQASPVNSFMRRSLQTLHTLDVVSTWAKGFSRFLFNLCDFCDFCVSFYIR